MNKDWLLKGEGPVFVDNTMDNDIKDQQKLDDLSFQDHKSASSIIQNLIEIESSNKKAFQDIAVYITGIQKGLKYHTDSQNEDVDKKNHPIKKTS